MRASSRRIGVGRGGEVRSPSPRSLTSAQLDRAKLSALETAYKHPPTPAQQRPPPSISPSRPHLLVTASLMAKRQLGLAEAFAHAQGASIRTGSPPAKRARLSTSPGPAAGSSKAASTASSSSATASSSTPATGGQDDGTKVKSKSTAPAAPFSPSTFLSSLSTSPPSPTESDLLALEGATLGASWLEHLAKELRKPYFLELKRFLWKEGLRGTEDRGEGGKLRVFPPGASLARALHSVAAAQRRED